MKKLIYADDLKEFFDPVSWPDIDFSAQAVQCVIESQPAIDAVPVVRCKDCKYIISSDCKWDEYQSNERDIEKDFCSFGERKE